MKIVSVVVPFSLNKEFDYWAGDDVVCGNLVVVNFSKKQTIGLVVRVKNEIESEFKLKEIIEVLNYRPFDADFIKFIRYVADYNLIPIGAVFKLVFSEKYVNNGVKLVNRYYFYSIENKKITQKQQNVVDFLRINRDNSYSFDELKQFCSLNVLKTLVKNGVVLEKQTEYKKRDYGINTENIKLNTLSEEQNAVFNDIISFFEKNNKPVLLEGTTGSGKTEIYFHLFEKLLKSGDGQILFLLPEIALTSQFIDRIKSQFSCADVAVWHSNITEYDRRNIWKGVLVGEIKVLVGARSSLFLPFKKLSLVVVDEEHDLSYKQVDNGCYNARDMAVLRAKICNCNIILGSATPSLESLINVDGGKYNYVFLKNRFGKSIKPIVNVVDMTKERLKSNKYLSHTLVNEMNTELEKNNQVLLFMNRRGYSPVAMCGECGYKFTCKRCSSTLTVHKKDNNFVCHQCGYKTKETYDCPSCGGKNTVIFFGPGVEKIEDEVKEYFPNKNIAVITSDTIQNVNKIKAIVDDISAGKVDIIIGTQMITKGYDFPKITLVGVLDADASLFGANFRSSERTYQLLTQVVGRAGRRETQGRAIIQSYTPDNVIIQALKNNDKDMIVEFEKENRKLGMLPPYSKLISLILSGKSEIKVYRKLREIASLFPINDKVDVYGPVQMNVYKINDDFRFRLLIKTENSINIQKLVSSVVDMVKMPNDLKLKIDVNPYFIG